MTKLNKVCESWLGFTLIELIMVIALMAILAVVALPRMMNNYDDAHYSSVAATGGALATSVMLVRSQWVSNGAQGEVDSLNGFGNNDIATTLSGWPSDAQKGAQSNHMPELGADASRCVRLWESLLITNGLKVATVSGPEVSFVAATADNSICVYTYQLSEVNSRIEYDMLTGTVLTVLK